MNRLSEHILKGGTTFTFYQKRLFEKTQGLILKQLFKEIRLESKLLEAKKKRYKEIYDTLD